MNYKTFLNISPIQIPNLLGAAFLELSDIVSEVYICAKDNASATKRKRPPVIIADSLSPNSTLRRAFKKMRESGESSSIDDKSILFDVATNQLQLLRAVLCLDKFAETVRDAIYSFGRDEQERLFLRALDAVQQDIINDGYITARIDVIRQWAGESVNLDLFVHECEQLQYQLHQISEHIQRFVDSSSLVESSTSFDLEAIKSRIHARLDPSMNRTPDCVREKLYTELYSVESMFAERFADVEKHKLDTISQPIDPSNIVPATVPALASDKLPKITAPTTDTQTLESLFEHTSKYIPIMNLLVQKEWCQPGTFLWIDESAGAKTTVAALIKYLHAQGFYLNNKKPSNYEIVSIAKNTFGVDLSIDTAKRTKVPSGVTHNLSFIKPASTY